MAGRTFQIVLDAVDPPKLAAFWRTALGYLAEPPPAGPMRRMSSPENPCE